MANIWPIDDKQVRETLSQTQFELAKALSEKCITDYRIF